MNSQWLPFYLQLVVVVGHWVGWFLSWRGRGDRGSEGDSGPSTPTSAPTPLYSMLTVELPQKLPVPEPLVKEDVLQPGTRTRWERRREMPWLGGEGSEPPQVAFPSCRETPHGL